MKRAQDFDNSQDALVVKSERTQGVGIIRYRIGLLQVVGFIGNEARKRFAGERALALEVAGDNEIALGMAENPLQSIGCSK